MKIYNEYTITTRDNDTKCNIIRFFQDDFGGSKLRFSIIQDGRYIDLDNAKPILMVKLPQQNGDTSEIIIEQTDGFEIMTDKGHEIIVTLKHELLTRIGTHECILYFVDITNPLLKATKCVFKYEVLKANVTASDIVVDNDFRIIQELFSQVQGTSHNHSNKDVLDSITSEAWGNKATIGYVDEKIAEASLADGNIDLSSYASVSYVNGEISKLQLQHGREIELQRAAQYIQWRYVGDLTWINLIPLVDIKGERGQDGYTPVKGVDYFDGRSFTYSDFTPQQLASLKGDKGDNGYTPIKGVDYFDGVNGRDGINGIDGQDGLTTSIFVNNATHTQSSGTITLPSYYTKTEVDNKIANVSSGGSVDLSEYYTKTEIDTNKADKTELHSHDNKTTLDSITGLDISTWNSKSNFDGNYNSLINKPTIPTVDVTKLYVDTELAKKVSAVDGKGLSTNDFTSTYKTKLDGLSNYALPTATASVLGGVKVGAGLSITNGVLSTTGGGVADSVEWSNVQNKPSFSTVATSGSYNDLSNKPIIPTVTNDLTSTLKTNYDTAYTHSQSSHLQLGTTGTTASVGNHTHTDLHSHSNKAILDTITQEKINTWDSGTGGSSSTSSSWTLIRNITTTEQVAKINITSDSNGTAFAYKEIMLVCLTTTHTVNYGLFFRLDNEVTEPSAQYSYDYAINGSGNGVSTATYGTQSVLLVQSESYGIDYEVRASYLSNMSAGTRTASTTYRPSLPLDAVGDGLLRTVAIWASGTGNVIPIGSNFKIYGR